MKRPCPHSISKECFPKRPCCNVCCHQCCKECCNNPNLKKRCCPKPCPPPIDCCPKSTPQFALISFNGTLNPEACIGVPQIFNTCTSASCNLVGQPVFFETLLQKPDQSDNVAIFFLPPEGGSPIPVPFVNGRSVFPPPPTTRPLRNGCSEFTINFNEEGLYVFTLNLKNAETGVTLASEKIGITVTNCTPIP